MPCAAELSFKIEGESFLDKEKLKEFNTAQPKH